MRISEHIYRIDGTNANVYVIIKGSEVLQVDAGFRGQFSKIRAFYEGLAQKPTAVLITHSHMDHIWELSRVKEAYSPEIFAHPLEAQVIEGRAPMYSPSKIMRALGLFLKPSPVTGVKDLKELAIEGLEVIETPGHTPGSTSFAVVDGGRRYIFVGDAAFEANGRLYVNRRYSLDVKAAEESLAKILRMGPATVLPGHGNPVSI